MSKAAISVHQLLEGRALLEEAPHGEKNARIDLLSRRWGISASRVRTHLRQVGWDSGRSRRRDEGESERITLRELEVMAEWFVLNERRSGKILGNIRIAREMLGRSGRIGTDAAAASDSTWARLLRRHGLSRTHIQTPSLSTELDSRHPNHWHFVDASIGVLFYLDKGKMKFRRVDLMDAKNKPQEFARAVSGRLLLVRWLLVDDYSGALVADYRESTGELATDLVDFLHYAWSEKADPRWPMKGVPFGLGADQGAPQKSAMVQSLCRELGVRLQLHESSHTRTDAPAARASGVVESMHNMWEHNFEVRWRYDVPTGGIDQIRAQARDFCITLNSDPAYKLRGTGLTRSQLWMDIEEKHLRLPPVELRDFRALAVGRAEERDIDAYGRVHLDGELYKIPNCTWSFKETVEVRRDPYASERVSVKHLRSGEIKDAIHIARRRNGRSEAAAYRGEAEVSREGIPGAHQPRHAVAKVRQSAQEALKEKAGMVAPGSLDTQLGHTAEQLQVTFIPRVGTPVISAAPSRRMDEVDVLELAVGRLGRGLSLEESRWVRERLSGPIPETRALELVEELAAVAGERRQVLVFPGAG